MMRSHGWQRPLHPLQIVGMSIFTFLVVAFYCFLGLFLGNRSAEISVTTIYSFLVLSVMFLFVRCTAINPTDKTSSRKLKKRANSALKLNYGFVFSQLIVRFFRRMERKILRSCIKRKYLDPWKTSAQMEPLLPFPLVMKDDAITPDPKEDDISFCSLCNMEVKKHSKHCRTCNRCVEGFDHHCRWLNNCVGKRNYTTFILLMIFVLLMLLIEGGTALAIFIRCFTDKRGVENELERKLYMKFPRGVLAAISIFLVLLTAYSSAALGQLFFFHVVLIRKGMKTYDYILAMKEANQSMELESIDDSDFSSDDESFDSDFSEKPSFISKFICRDQVNQWQKPQRLSIRIESEPEQPVLNKKQGFHASINPWKLITMNREKALLAAAKAREKLADEKAMVGQDSLKPLPLETKRGPSFNIEKDMASEVSGASIISQTRHPTSPSLFSSPRRRFSSSPSRTAAAAAASPKHRYKSSFDLKLTEVSRELETYISRQVLCSVLKETGSEASPG
ncbi:hypothetical protein AgCh_038832 [Apium graveolens]